MDIREYLKRISYQGSLEPTLQTLHALHHAHLLAVPFENLSIRAKQPILLQEEALFDKIVRQGRGGFCYELNGLFAWLLRELNFQVSLLSAGVSNGAGGFSPEYDHLALLIHHLSGADWLADVGFGDSFLRPLRFEAEMQQDGADGRTYHLLRTSQEVRDSWTVERHSDAQWEPQYRFTLQPHDLADFTERCHYQQTSPESHFTQNRICSLATPTGRITLSEMRLITTSYGKRTEQGLTSQQEYVAALYDHFGIVLL